MSLPTSDSGFSEDRLLGGRVRLRQPLGGNRASVDAVLLAAAVPARPGQTVADLGAGSGVAGLCLAARVAGLTILAADDDPAMVALAADNFGLNRVAGRVVRLDVAERGAIRAAAGLAPDSADHVMANPPFLSRDAARQPPDDRRRRAFVADVGVDIWVRAATATVRPGGTVTVIHRPDALCDLLAAYSGRTGGVAVLPVLPRADAAAIRVVVQGIRGSRAPLRLLPPLVLHPAIGSGFTPEAERLLSAAAACNLAPVGQVRVERPAFPESFP